MLLQDSQVTLKDGAVVTLRSPRVEEAAAMLVYLRTLFHESWPNLNSNATHFDGMSEQEEAATLARFASAKQEFFLTAFDGERPVGNLGFNVLPGALCSHGGQLGMGVLREYQGRGLGRALITRAIDEATRLGIWNLRLTVRVENLAAIALYERAGFTRVGRLRAVANVGDRYVDEFQYQRLAPPAEVRL